jgi:DNA-binding XRE family transcriptional regulator
MSDQRVSVLLRLDLVWSDGKIQVVSAAALGSVRDPWPQDHLEFGPAIKQARQRAGLSQAKFARQVGVTEMTLRNVENGHNPPSPQTRAAIVETLTKLGQAPADTAEGMQASADAVRTAIALLQSQVPGVLTRREP